MAAALFAGYLCRLIFIPTIVGFIASGYLFSLYDGSGKSLLDIPSEIGVELLLFSIGLKIKPSSLLNPSLFFVFLMHSSAIFFIFLILFVINFLNTCNYVWFFFYNIVDFKSFSSLYYCSNVSIRHFKSF